jgi:nitrate reductase beta subunit
VAVENFRMLQQRQTQESLVSGGSKQGRVNLLNWDGKGVPAGLFPERPAEGVGQAADGEGSEGSR